MLTSIAAALVACALTAVSARALAPRLAGRLGLVGVDVHKPDRPRVPEAGGVALLVGVAGGYTVLWLAEGWPGYAALALTAATAWLVGFIDDLVRLDAISKPLLTLVAGLPLLAAGAYEPYLHIPFAGEFRLTVVYPALVLAGVMVSSNMFNMIDVLNGSMVLPALVILSGMAAATALLQGPEGQLAPLLVAIAALAGYAPFNVYPARLFNGDQGSLLVGALVAALAVVTGLEAFAVIASLPLVLNGFQILASAGGLRERGEMPRPTRFDESRVCIEASDDDRAPVTLVQLATLRHCVCEPTIVAAVALLTLVSTLLALATLAADAALPAG